jgi:hypothetical protein
MVSTLEPVSKPLLQSPGCELRPTLSPSIAIFQANIAASGFALDSFSLGLGATNEF